MVKTGVILVQGKIKLKERPNKLCRKITKISKQDKCKDELLDFENPKAHKLTLPTKIMKIRASCGEN